MRPPVSPLVERFWSKVEPQPSGCWEWTASRGVKGYGQFAVTSSYIARSSRIAWTLTFGPIPDGLFVCHECDNPPCVRPDHLFLGTADDNFADAVRKGRFVPNRRQGSACMRGHAFTPENTYYRSNGSKRCRTCRTTAARSGVAS